MDLKQDLRCDTIDTREEYEMKVGKRGGARARGLLGTGALRACRVEVRAGLGRSVQEVIEETGGGELLAENPGQSQRRSPRGP